MTTPALAVRTFNGLTIPEPGTFVLDQAHTIVSFVARHLVVSKVRGTFSEVAGTITVGEDPLSSTVEASISAASLSTGAPDRDDHVRGADFLDVQTYPQITFRGTRVASHHGNEFVLAGDLTVRDVTREVELKVEFEGLTRDPWGREVVAFTAATEIDREKFGITWNKALEAGGVLVGPVVKIEIVAEAHRQA